MGSFKYYSKATLLSTIYLKYSYLNSEISSLNLSSEKYFRGIWDLRIN
jgi:hypothetical protein